MNFFAPQQLPNVIHPPPNALRFAFHLLLIILLFAVLTAIRIFPVSAQTHDAEVEFFVESSEAEEPLTVGDRIRLRLEVYHPVESTVLLPQVEPEWELFEVVDQTPPQTVQNEDGTATTGKDIVVTLFEPGQYQTPRVVVTHRKSDGSQEELAAPVISLKITTVLTDDTELRDIKPQAELPEPAVWPWLVGGFLLSLLLTGLLVGAGLWAYHRWRAQALPLDVPLPIIDTRPPEVIAYAELDRIEALDLPAQSRIKEHYSLVANCLRYYIEGRYNLPALEQTTGELRTAFRRLTVPMRDVAAFMSLLSESDFVKFARYQPRAEEVHSLIDRARTVVDATTPVPEPAEPVAPEAEVLA